jgi:hypothetical protein
MPKVPSSLYDHSSRNATARQLNISTNTSGRASYSYTSSQIPVAPIAPQPHHDHDHDQEFFIPDAMDVDEHPTPKDVEEDEIVEVTPGVHVVLPKKRYKNSVGSFIYHNYHD